MSGGAIAAVEIGLSLLVLLFGGLWKRTFRRAERRRMREAFPDEEALK